MSRKLDEQVRALRQMGAKDDRDAAAMVNRLFPKQGKKSKAKMARVVKQFPKAR